ncbi:MAG: hypothetical protein U1A27_06940 [Phycisphaerae bacterium]
MAKRKMSPEARKRISEAVKNRWAKYRSGVGPRMGRKKGKPAGKAAPKAGKATGRRGRKPGKGRAAMGSASNLAGVATAQLLSMRRQIDLELADRYVREQA